MSAAQDGDALRPQPAARSLRPPVVRPLTEADIPAAMALVRQVGWNQTPADWMRFLRAQPRGCFAEEVDGRVAGTVATIVYDEAPPLHTRAAATGAPAEARLARRLAWIGMVIVDETHRGRGCAARLLDRALEHLDDAGVACVKLDATPLGRELYEKRGFVAELEITRWALARETSGPKGFPRPADPSPPIEAIVELDRRLFEADRGDLLRSMAEDAPDLTIAVRDGDDVIGYGCGRRGTRADHLGPWMGRDEEAGAQVLRMFLERSTRALVFVDILEDNPWSSRLVDARGFRLSRALTRMYRGAPSGPGDLRLLGAIVGPEFG